MSITNHTDKLLTAESTQSNNEIVRDLALAATEVTTTVRLPDGDITPVLFVHKDMREVDKSHLMKQPLNISVREEFGTVESFIAYINEFGTSPFISGKPLNYGRIFEAVLDYHAKDKPSHCRHKSELFVENSAQWKKWSNSECTRLSQRDFVNFIEDNIEDIMSPDSAELIQQIRETRVEGKSKTTNKIEDSGDSTDQSASLKLATEVPAPMSLALKPWKCMTTHMEITARIYVHINNSGPVTFSYQLINADSAIEQKFNDYRKLIEKETGKTVYV